MKTYEPIRILDIVTAFDVVTGKQINDSPMVVIRKEGGNVRTWEMLDIRNMTRKLNLIDWQVHVIGHIETEDTPFKLSDYAEKAALKEFKRDQRKTA